jgi:hypothetical protein
MGQARRRRQQRKEAIADRPFSDYMIETYLPMESQREVASLLCSTIPNWTRAYSPLPEYAGQIKKIRVGCIEDLALVEIVPVANATPS